MGQSNMNESCELGLKLCTLYHSYDALLPARVLFYARELATACNKQQILRN